jgi:radical SAM protein with 4Fe4S-binding SPASM domain
MKEDVKQALRKLNDEGNYVGVLRLALSAANERPNDIKVRYCLAMAYIAKGDRNSGLKHLQILIDQSLKDNRADMLHRLFVNKVILQSVELAEWSLHGGDSLGKNTLQMVKDVKKFGQKYKEKELELEAENILNRWIHKNADGQPVVAYIPDSPLTLQVEPTNVCNLSCTMCPRSKMTRSLGFMDPTVFDEMLGGWKNRVLVKPLRHILFGSEIPLLKRGSIKLFFMGEPLIHPQLDRLIESGNHAGCNVGIQTNGTALNRKEVRERILAAKPSVIGISLDGINEMSFQSVRQGARWQDICKGIEALHHERMEMGFEKKVLILVSSIIPEWNPPAQERAQKFLESVRPYVDQIGFVPLSRERDPEFYNEDGEIAAYAKRPMPGGSKLQPICSEPLTKLNVLWDGRITPCCYDIDGEMPLGHVHDGIDQVWRSDKVKSLQEALLNHDFMKHPLCKACMGSNIMQ